WRELTRRGRRHERVPAPPLHGLDLVRPGPRLPHQRAHVDRAQLVLLDAPRLRAVGEVRQHDPQVDGAEAELVGEPPPHRVLHRLPRAGVAATGVGAHAGERGLVPCPPRDEQPTVPVEPVAGEREVQRGGGAVDGGLVGGADGAPFVVEEHDLLGRAHGSTVDDPLHSYIHAGMKRGCAEPPRTPPPPGPRSSTPRCSPSPARASTGPRSPASPRPPASPEARSTTTSPTRRRCSPPCSPRRGTPSPPRSGPSSTRRGFRSRTGSRRSRWPGSTRCTTIPGSRR